MDLINSLMDIGIAFCIILYLNSSAADSVVALLLSVVVAVPATVPATVLHLQSSIPFHPLMIVLRHTYF